MRRGQVKEALRAARRLALLTYSAGTSENTLRRHQWHERQRQVQAEARAVERFTRELGVKEEPGAES